MSVLETPRIYFQGEITWDPIVTNNYPKFYDEAAAKPTLGNGTTAEYRSRAIQDVANGNWNVDGTHRSTFFATTVTGVDLGQGHRTDDALIGVPVAFSGKLVDLDPYGATSSQLFFDQLSVGIQGGCQIRAPRLGPMVARRINFARNQTYKVIAGVASVMWQASFRADAGLSIQPHGSAALAALNDLVTQPDIVGLTVRLNAYRTVYYDSQSPTPAMAQALARDLRQGGFHPNPARSLIVGVVGLWRKEETAAVPGDRVLAPVTGSPVWTAFARVGAARLELDLSNSIPETDFDAVKANLGPLTASVTTEGGQVELGTLDYAAYAAEAYTASSGIVTLPLDAAQEQAARNGDLSLRTDSDTLLQEQSLSVAADPPNIYVEPGEQADVTLRAFRRGQRPGEPVSVTLVEIGGPLPPMTVQTDADGIATVPIQGGKPGIWTWVLVPWIGTQPALPTRLDTAQSNYLVLRTLPADATIARMKPTWDNVQRFVLRDWEALAPCMDNWLRLGNEQQCRAYAALIRKLTDRDRFNDYDYMPVTRDLTPGQRTLLHAWCDAVTGQPASATAAAARAKVVTTAAAPPPQPFGRGF